MVTVLALLTARPGHEKDVELELRRLLQDTSREAGVKSYFVARDPATSTSFVVYERYLDVAARDAHFASPHLRAALSRLEPRLLAAAPVVRFLDEVEALDSPPLSQ